MGEGKIPNVGERYAKSKKNGRIADRPVKPNVGERRYAKSKKNGRIADRPVKPCAFAQRAKSMANTKKSQTPKDLAL